MRAMGAKAVDPNKLSLTMDARIWAATFMEAQAVHGPFDEATMQTWFANALCCGYDHGIKRRKDDV